MRLEPPFLLWDRRQAQKLAWRPRHLRWRPGRRVLFALAGAILLACAISHPLQLLFTVWTRLVRLVIAGFVVAAVVHGWALIWFRRRSTRRRTRSAALVFLFVALVVVNAVLRLADWLVGEVFATDPLVSSATAGYVLLAFELLWIAVLETLF